jgi:membrane-bound lytic murein transglycosylase D
MRRDAFAATITITVETGLSAGQTFTHTDRFQIGRHGDCAIRIADDVVSRHHAELFVEQDQWWIADLGSANGIFINGQRIQRAPLMGSGRFRLGINGPAFSFSIDAAPLFSSAAEQSRAGLTAMDPPTASESAAATDLEHYKQHYFSDVDGLAAGEHTMMVRRAFADVRKKQRRIYLAIIGLAGILLIVTGALAIYKHNQVARQRQLAAEVFYTMRAMEIDLMKLQVEFEKMRSREAKIQIDVVKTQKRKLEESYDRYVDSLDVYRPGMSEKEKIILRMARRFGECEIKMPDGFVDTVSAFIEKWQSKPRLARVVARARRLGYVPVIVHAMAQQELPAQFFYLAVQESNLNSQAVGPKTRFGFAKGMWQFIAQTGVKYGLAIGPLKDQPVVDPLDDRLDFQKSTQAAARYLRDIYTTDAQASGLLVMASYNWGERRVIKLIQSMPENPRERNFWQLISKYRDQIPEETYDYVFSIFSAAVIGENPRLFGFDFDNPLAPVGNPSAGG